MPLIVRQHNYVSGALIVASQNNTNENTLYNLVNGSLDADNFASLAESVVTFSTSSGHDHDGANSTKINISGAGPMMQVTGTGTDHAFKGSSSSSGTHAGVYGVGTTANALGGYFENTSSGVGMIVAASTSGIGMRVYNANGVAGGSTAEFHHRSTTSGSAAVKIVEAASSGYGLYTLDLAGIPIYVNQGGSGTVDAVKVSYTSSSNVGANISLTRSINGEVIRIGSTGTPLTATCTGLEMTTNRTSGFMLYLSSTSSGASTESLIVALSASTSNSGEVISSASGKMAFARAVCNGAEALEVTPDTATTASATGYVKIGDSGVAITGDALYVYGDVHVTGSVTADGGHL